MASTESGSYQLHTWDRRDRRAAPGDRGPGRRARGAADARRRRASIWFHDETGAESGSYVIARVRRADVGPEPLIEGLPNGWPEGLAIGRTRTVAGVSTDEGFSVWTAERGGVARQIHEHPEPVRLAGGWGLTSAVDRRALSSDETLAVLEVMEDGDVLHPSLRSIDAVTGATVAELRDEGLELSGFAFSPLPGDTRMAITHERTGERRPAIWDARTRRGDRPAARARRAGRARRLVARRLGAAPAPARRRAAPPPPLRPRRPARVTPLETEPGSITAAAVRPDGEVWYRVHNGLHPATLLAAGSTTPLLAPEGSTAPEGRPFEPWWFENPNGQRVHGFLVRPGGRRARTR